jgi:hypothetical protein
LRYLPVEGWNLSLHPSMLRQFGRLGVDIPAASSCLQRQVTTGLDSFAQINKADDAPGEARQSGNPLSAAITHFLFR